MNITRHKPEGVSGALANASFVIARIAAMFGGENILDLSNGRTLIELQ